MSIIRAPIFYNFQRFLTPGEKTFKAEFITWKCEMFMQRNDK